jgi:hypothetical protein
MLKIKVKIRFNFLQNSLCFAKAKKQTAEMDALVVRYADQLSQCGSEVEAKIRELLEEVNDSMRKTLLSVLAKGRRHQRLVRDYNDAHTLDSIFDQ